MDDIQEDIDDYVEERRCGPVGVKKEGENASLFLVLLVCWKILDS